MTVFGPNAAPASLLSRYGVYRIEIATHAMRPAYGALARKYAAALIHDVRTARMKMAPRRRRHG